MENGVGLEAPRLQQHDTNQLVLVRCDVNDS